MGSDIESRLTIVEIELAATRAELESAREMIKEMADGFDDESASELVERTEERIQEMHAASRMRVESIVQDAENLRTMAASQVEEATQFARAQLERKTKLMVAEAENLTETARGEADRIVAEANEYRADVQGSIDRILDQAESILRTADEKVAEADRKLAEARRMADQTD